MLCHIYIEMLVSSCREKIPKTSRSALKRNLRNLVLLKCSRSYISLVGSEFFLKPTSEDISVARSLVCKNTHWRPSRHKWRDSNIGAKVGWGQHMMRKPWHLWFCHPLRSELSGSSKPFLEKRQVIANQLLVMCFPSARGNCFLLLPSAEFQPVGLTPNLGKNNCSNSHWKAVSPCLG